MQASLTPGSDATSSPTSRKRDLPRGARSDNICFLKIWTIGHSTRSWDHFVAVLKAHGVEAIADVRRFPASRRHPQFKSETMARALAKENIAYAHLPALGGRRPTRSDSPNTAWRNASFRGYADHMSSSEYVSGEKALKELASERRTAVMCAEVVWWHCHRGLISDSLKAQGWEVLHIESERPPREHPFTGAARVVRGQLTYAAGQEKLL